MKKTKILLAPSACGTFERVCKLNTDNHSRENSWILVDGGTVTIAKQKFGEPCNAMVELDKSEFDALIRWYHRKQVCRKK